MAKPPPEYVLHLEDQLSALGPIETARFFGGWSFSLHGVRFAYVIRGALHFPTNGEMNAALEAEGCEPFRYEKGGRDITVRRFREAPAACLGDPEALVDWARRSAQAAGAL